jgi:alkylation response protein AidB-like acyl-CoA dehydrogenase
MGDLGLFGMTVSPDYGGHGLDYLSYIIAVEEIARVDGSHAATVAAENSLGIGPIYYFGSEAQKRRYLPDLCSGKRLWGFGLTESSAGSDAGGTKTTARLDGDGWVINGSKIFITNAGTPMTAGSTVQCVTGTGPDGEGIQPHHRRAGRRVPTRTMHNKLVWRSSNTAELYFDNVQCRAKTCSASAAAASGRCSRRSTAAASRSPPWVSAARRAYEAALAYAKADAVRQADQHVPGGAFKLADMATGSR